MKCNTPLITSALLDPERLGTLSPSQWDVLIRQGRRSNLLARLAVVLSRRGAIDAVPSAPRNHLVSALTIARRQALAVAWEVNCIAQALGQAGIPFTLLKGAAYVMSGLAAGEGRTFSDVDILVQKDQLERTEVALMVHGWKSSHTDAYDQRYYRQWMHEIPPMVHVSRGTTVDVHHAILPETARIKVNTRALFDALVALPQQQAHVHVLSPADMLLHSATHLFNEGDLDNGLRDLFDLDALLREFGTKPGFWDSLVPRAQSLGLTRPLFYALRYTSALLGTPVPAATLSASHIGKPSSFTLGLMDACYTRALRPDHTTASYGGSWLARFALYLRSHWMRMPLHLLAYHLTRKTLLKKPSEDAEPLANANTKRG